MLRNSIFQENCIKTMNNMPDNFIDGVICSPPYNISTTRSDMYYNTGYAEFDNLSEEEYLEVRLNEFKEFQRVVKDNGVVLYNLSYTHENPILPNLLVTKIHQETDLTLADIIYWKKSNAIPFQTSPTKLSRIVEPVYVFVRKEHLSNFVTNKMVSKINEKTKQKFYKNYLNFIEAPNNDQNKAPLKALYSTDLVCQLIDVYFPTGSLIYDPFMGSGTTARACVKMGRDYLGSELKEEHYDFAIKSLI